MSLITYTILWTVCIVSLLICVWYGLWFLRISFHNGNPETMVFRDELFGAKMKGRPWFGFWSFLLGVAMIISAIVGMIYSYKSLLCPFLRRKKARQKKR